MEWLGIEEKEGVEARRKKVDSRGKKTAKERSEYVFPNWNQFWEEMGKRESVVVEEGESCPHQVVVLLLLLVAVSNSYMRRLVVVTGLEGNEFVVDITPQVFLYSFLLLFPFHFSFSPTKSHILILFIKVVWTQRIPLLLGYLTPQKFESLATRKAGPSLARTVSWMKKGGKEVGRGGEEGEKKKLYSGVKREEARTPSPSGGRSRSRSRSSPSPSDSPSESSKSSSSSSSSSQAPTVTKLR